MGTTQQEAEAELGFTVTLKDIYLLVLDNNKNSSERIRKLEIQVGAQWIIVAAIVVVAGSYISRTLGV